MTSTSLLDPTRADHALRRRLRPLHVAVVLQGTMLWVPVEKLFMSEIGFTAASIGVMAAAYAAVVPLLEVPSGILADRWSRRGVLVVAAVAVALCALVGGLSHGVGTYIVSALFLGVFFAMYSGTLDSVVYDTVLEETGGGDGFERRIGRIRLLEGLSFAVSALAGGLIAGATSPRLTYFLTVPCAVLAVLALSRFREPRLHQAEERVPLSEHVRITLRAVTARASVLPIVAAGALGGVVLQMLFEFGPVWLVTLAVPAFVYGPYWAGLTGTLALGGAMAGRLRLEDRPGVVVGVTAAMLGATVTMAASHSLALVAAAQILCALLLVVVGIHVSQRLHDAVASNVRAGVASGVSTLTWLAFLPVALLFGAIANNYGVHTAAWLLTGLVLAAGASLLRLATPRGSAVELACDEVVELASDLVDGELTPAERAQVEEHRSRCPGCTRYLDQLRELRRVLASLGS